MSTTLEEHVMSLTYSNEVSEDKRIRNQNLESPQKLGRSNSKTKSARPRPPSRTRPEDESKNQSSIKRGKKSARDRSISIPD